MPMMRALWRTLCTLRTERKAATAVEYGLIVALIVIAMIAALSTLADITTSMWNNVNTAVTTVS
jgi:pilus assembly protein Flp/PilA